MDNLTHSLIGYALGRALPGGAPRTPRERAGIWSAVVASNLPDADFAARFFSADPQLAYLIHHRGHTHTLLLALPLGLVTGLVCARAFSLPRRQQLQVVSIGGLAGLLHIAFDALNNYGVHPFWPLDNRWYYGDAVFIVEPLLLAALIPLLAVQGHTRTGRMIGYASGAGLCALLWLSGLLAPVHAGALTALVLAAFAIHRRFAPSALAVLGVVTGLVLLFFSAARVAQHEVRAALAQARPEERLLDLVANALPGNPLCFQTLALSVDREQRYRARKGRLALTPALLALDACTLRGRDQPTAPLVPEALAIGAGVSFESVFTGDARELRALRDRDCDAEAMLRFVRAPFWLAQREPAVLGDLRYDRGPGLEFAERELTGRCDDRLPTPVPPRADLLR